MRNRAAYVLTLALASALPVLSYADEPDEAAMARAKEYFDKGKLAFELGRFEEAIDWFEKAYEETELPDFLLNIAQCYKQLGKCDKAIFLYKQYQRQENVDREGVQKLIDQCQEQIEQAKSQPTLPPEDNLYTYKARFSLEGRALFAAGAAGSQETGGQNLVGGGLAAGATALFPVGERLALGGQVEADLRLPGIKVEGGQVNDLRPGLDLRGNLLLLGQYLLSPGFGAFGGAGVVVSPGGGDILGLRVTTGALLNVALPAHMKMTASVGFEAAGIDDTASNILGCEAGQCSYQQLDVAVGVRFPLR